MIVRAAADDAESGLGDFSGQALRVGLRTPPAIEDIRHIPGVASADTADGFVRLLPVEGQDPTDAIVRASVEHGWGLHYLAPEAASLEDIFVQLTTTEQEQPA